MNRKILFFINPVSGTKNKLPLEKRIIERCNAAGIAFEILFTSVERDYLFLRDKIYEESFTDIVVCGGDGSLAPVIGAVLNVPVNIGIIPLGSGNGLARTARIPSPVDRAIDVILQGKSKCTDAFLINNRLGVHVCGLGFDARVAHEFSKGKTRGLHAYTKIAIKNFLTARAHSFIIEADGKSITLNAFFICVANSNQFGNNLKVAPKASISDGLLDVVILQKTTKLDAVLSFAGQIFSGQVHPFSEKPLRKKNILYFQTKNLKIKNPGNAWLHIDGDPAETANDFSIEILPSAFRLLQS